MGQTQPEITTDVKTLPKRAGWRRHLPFALYTFALASLILALARPVINTFLKLTKREKISSWSRQGQHLIPTQKALEIDRSLGEPLESLRQLLSPVEFDPLQCVQTFNIVTTDYAMQTILPFALPLPKLSSWQRIPQHRCLCRHWLPFGLSCGLWCVLG